MTEPIRVLKQARHRNGIAGEPFTVAIIKDVDGSKKLVVMFEQEAHTAVFDLALLAEEVIEFGENSWRGDEYESKLRETLHADDFVMEPDYFRYLTEGQQ